MTKFGICDKCSRRDSLTYVAAVSKNLCPSCAAPIIRMPASLLRMMLSSETKIERRI
jgi:hypothetical protein